MTWLLICDFRSFGSAQDRFTIFDWKRDCFAALAMTAVGKENRDSWFVVRIVRLWRGRVETVGLINPP